MAATCLAQQPATSLAHPDSASIAPAVPESTSVRFRPAIEAPAPPRSRSDTTARAHAGRRALESVTSQAGRTALPELVPLLVWEAGTPQRVEPLFWGVAGREAVEVRVDGLPVAPTRWPETPLLPVPLLALEEIRGSRTNPASGPLSSTGGSVLDLRLAPPAPGQAVSAIRLTRGSYGTFTEEVVLRRPLGRVLVGGFYGDTKSNGRILWGRQDGQTIGARAVHSFAGGWASWGWDDATDRSRLLATKKANWDRTAATLRWWRGDSGASRLDAAVTASEIRGRWETLLGITERRGRHLFLHAIAETPADSLGWGAALEVEGARVHVRRPGEARRLLEDLSYAVTVTHRGLGAVWQRRFTLGVARHAPTAPAPIGSLDLSAALSRGGRLHVQAGRAVRNRTLPRLPSDGAAWVLNGIGLADERDGEEPEALWRGTIAVERADPLGAVEGNLGVDVLWQTNGLGAERDWLEQLGIDGQGQLPAGAQRRDARFAQPWMLALLRPGAGFSVSADGRGTLASESATGQIGLPELQGRAALAWEGTILKGDLGLRLQISARARTQVATPYGRLPSLVWTDGEALARVGDAELFWVLANATNVNGRSFAFDGTFQPLPRRHYRAGLRWVFFN